MIQGEFSIPQARHGVKVLVVKSSSVLADSRRNVESHGAPGATGMKKGSCALNPWKPAQIFTGGSANGSGAKHYLIST